MAEPTYKKTVPGTEKLPEIARLIHQEEMEFLRAFIDSKIDVTEGETLNLITFEKVHITKVPTECILLPHGQAAPDGATKTWSGTMVSSGTTGQVDMYRVS